MILNDGAASLSLVSNSLQGRELIQQSFLLLSGNNTMSSYALSYLLLQRNLF